MTDVQKKSNLNTVSVSYHTDARYEQLLAFLNVSLNGQSYNIDSLPGDASFRRYHRIYLDNPLSHQDPSYIVMDAPPQLESIESFVRVDRLLSSKVNVPSIIAEDIANGFLILQDFGKTEFAHLLHAHKSNHDLHKVDELYRLAIDSLLELQNIPVDMAMTDYGIPVYDASMLHNETALFNEWFLPYIGASLEADSRQHWQQFIHHLIDKIINQPRVVVHRDYHSRNLMQDQYHPEALGSIDFQDAVIGSYTYDLVSLVRDAYVEWDEALIDSWIDYYWQQITGKYSLGAQTLEAFKVDVNLMGIQRHLKVLGIFVRLSERDGKSRYLEDIPKVWQDLMHEMNWLKDHADAETTAFIDPVYTWLINVVEPKYVETFKR